MMLSRVVIVRVIVRGVLARMIHEASAVSA